ncbi:hypothetical protein [Mesoplasma florum]|uniref:hypothetical protein n=1 Tax=Mesoplasma florum TaxID=2151 RepID=UPI000D02E0AE|nr:hypothetical protein [Mesoplasma florum]AVN59061.1 hypothetical protein CG009_02405 [Mesoplasma florum]
MFNLSENKIVKIWDYKNSKTDLSKKPRFWLVLKINNEIILTNLSSSYNFFAEPLKTKCAMLTKNTCVKVNNKMTIKLNINESELVEYLDYIFNDCSCIGGCIEKNQFLKIIDEFNKFRENEFDTNIILNISDLKKLSDWDYSKVRNSKNNNFYVTKEEFIKSVRN